MDYLYATYFNHGLFSFRNQETFEYFANGNDDITSNCVEAINYKLNCLFHNSKKTVAYVCRVLHKFHKLHGDDKNFALLKNDFKYLRKRTKKVIKRFADRRDLVLGFDMLTDREKLQRLSKTMFDIGILGVKAPVNHLHTEPSVTQQ